MQNTFIIIAAILGLLGVGLGAFGAHALADTLTANGRADTFETANRYHLIHAILLLVIGILLGQFDHSLIQWAGWCTILGIIFFSGSFYILAIFDIPIMGAVAPIGGVAFLLGWGLIALGVWQSS
jgi:uncharacterized membrane protein YgdD (TMEM256/DUF423 family)